MTWTLHGPGSDLRGDGGRLQKVPVKMDMGRVYSFFEDLRGLIPKPKTEKSTMASWISQETWRLEGKKVVLQSEARPRQLAIRWSSKKLLREDRKQQTEREGDNLEAILTKDLPDVKEALAALKGGGSEPEASGNSLKCGIG